MQRKLTASLMTAQGHSATCGSVRAMSVLAPIADSGCGAFMSTRPESVRYPSPIRCVQIPSVGKEITGGDFFQKNPPLKKSDRENAAPIS
jgi:hypothetical protein